MVELDYHSCKSLKDSMESIVSSLKGIEEKMYRLDVYLAELGTHLDKDLQERNQ